MEKKRVEDITAALYRVTERMDEHEPLRWRLRQCALELSELFLKEKDLSYAEESKKEELLKSLQYLLGLASTLSYSARINFEILHREYLGLESPKQSLSEPAISKENPAEEVRGSSTDRQKKIIDFLKTSENSSIGDIALLFESSISEKTLQRDLNDLILEGTVKAEGERRWRRYSIYEKQNSIDKQ